MKVFNEDEHGGGLFSWNTCVFHLLSSELSKLAREYARECEGMQIRLWKV